MQWRVVVELSGEVGVIQVHEVHSGGSTVAGCSAAMLGLTLVEAKPVLGSLQRHLAQAQTEEHCQARRRCPRCGAHRPLKDRRPRRLRSLFGVVEVRAPRFDPCRCSVTLRATISPVAEIMPDCCTPEYERVLANLGAPLPYRRARALLEHFFPIGDGPTIETIRKRALQVGARLEHEAVASPNSVPVAEAETIALSIDSGHVRAVRSYQVRTFEVFVALAGNDDGQQIVFSSVPVEADRQTQQLRGVLHRLGATPCTEAIILSDCAVEHIRWRLWHGQVQRVLDLMGDTLAALDVTAATPSPAATTAGKIAGALRGLESYVATQAALIIDYATARHCEEPISTAATERSASDAEGPDLIGQRHLRSGPCCR